MADPVARKEGWTGILAQCIDDAREQPFEWGQHDCCLFAANVVQAMTGVDYAANYRDKYNSETGAAKLLKRAGGLEQIVTKALGASFPVALAQRGDVVGLNTDKGLALGICTGAHAAFVADDGLRMAPTLSCERAWRVG